MSWLWVLAALLIAGVVFFLYRRTHTDSVSEDSNAGTATLSSRRVAIWGKKLISPQPDQACQAARELFGKPIPIDETPKLPLAGCSGECHCQYENVPERRVGAERRHGKDRREELRFEANERRRANDRRQADGYKWDSTI
jgi:hypothetical protein